MTLNQPDELLNRVSCFYLSNRVRIESLNFLADNFVPRLRQSFGIMVNYSYKVGDIEANHEAFRGEKCIVASSTVKSLLLRSERRG